MSRRNWQPDELLLVLHLYCRTPFGKLHRRNPEIKRLAEYIGRTPGAVAMKAGNFGYLDPFLQQKGLSSVAEADRVLWERFLNNRQTVALEAETLFERYDAEAKDNTPLGIADPPLPTGPTEITEQVKVRRVQGFFRRAVMARFDNQCAVSGLKLKALIVASHIIPWSKDEERRADPANGIALNSLYDKAFDEGYMTFDEDLRVCLAKDLKSHLEDSALCKRLLDVEGFPMRTRNFKPDPKAMEYHRDHCFEKYK